MSIHGIAIRRRDTNKLVSFIKCPTGREALQILSGSRRNLGSGYTSNEEVITDTEYQEMKDNE